MTDGEWPVVGQGTLYIAGKMMGYNQLYRHKKRGTVYRILHIARFQYSGNLGDDDWWTIERAVDDAQVVVYQDVDSMKVWVRPVDQFFDTGRFEFAGRDTLENDE